MFSISWKKVSKECDCLNAYLKCCSGGSNSFWSSRNLKLLRTINNPKVLDPQIIVSTALYYKR